MNNHINSALLSDLAYVSFLDGNGSIISNKEIIQQRLEKYGWTSNRVREFNQNYDILAQKSTKSGYSDTIVRNKHTNEIIVAHKGTQSAQDWLQDGILVIKGLPQAQASDAKEFVDNAIKSGLIKGNFRNVGHSLGHAIATVVHLTTNNSSGATGFNIK